MSDTGIAEPERQQESASARASEDPVLPLKLYGPEVSYFTGKLEAGDPLS